MPWTDNSDPGGRGGSKPPPKPGGKPGHHGPWGAPTPSNDRGEPPTQADRRPARPKRNAPPPPPPDDLVVLLRRLARRLEQELAALRAGFGRWLIPSLVVAAIGAWMLTGFYVVQRNQEAMVMRLGALSRTAGPGLRYHLPYPIETVVPLPVGALNQTSIGNGAGPLKEGLMLTGDGSIINIGFAVQWRIVDPAKYLFAVRDAQDALRAVSESAMRQAVGRARYADLQGPAKAKVESDAAAAIQAALDRYGAGVQLISVRIETADAPPAVASDASPEAATQDAQTAINQANAYATHAIDAAKEQAAEKTRGAQAYRTQAIAAARTEADAFNAELAQVQRDPSARERLYIDTMQRILQRSKTIVVDARGTNAPLVLPADSGAQPQPQAPQP